MFFYRVFRGGGGRGRDRGRGVGGGRDISRGSLGGRAGEDRRFRGRLVVCRSGWWSFIYN